MQKDVNSSKSSKQFSKPRAPFREDFQLRLVKHTNSSHFHEPKAGLSPAHTQSPGADGPILSSGNGPGGSKGPLQTFPHGINGLG